MRRAEIEALLQAGLLAREEPSIIVESSGTHFDPSVVEVFCELEEQFREVCDSMEDWAAIQRQSGRRSGPANREACGSSTGRFRTLLSSSERARGSPENRL
jgi:hypothetical protein